ncbi:hypothetical protein POM88_013690 [Heracleum sosnowskyi]|uniref:NAC domain-containing protein n=1 Tax=Heracleum sosnowskyi TaxID=360622 RepID=A0AAD8J0J1_9APIA|nr:hypothetical protein POM88_013690 [Heracleum sosnowskyi]
MGSQLLEFAPGAFFTPTDRQIIDFYLKPKILGNSLKFDVVADKQVFGVNSNPWQVLDIHDDHSWFDCADNEFERIRFVYTKLSKMATCNSKNNTTRTRENSWRKAGCGTWTSKSKPVEITDFHGNVIGEKRYYVFRIKNSDSDSAAAVLSQFGSFRMHEFCLSGIYQNFDPSSTRVLCKITHQSCKNLLSPVIATNSTSNLIEPPTVLDNENFLVQVTNNDQGAECVPEIADFEIADFEESSTEPSALDSDPFDSDPIVVDDALLNEVYEFLNSTVPVPEDEDTTALGKRKLEQESFCGTKKLCLG